MKKSAIAVSLALVLGSASASAATMTSATFTMYSGTGGTVGVDNTVTGDIGGGTWSVASTTTFFGALWTAHSGTTFGPGTYTFDTIEGGVYTGVVVGAGQVGGHILFDWGTTTNIDVINVWDVNWDNNNSVFTYTSSDVTAGAGTGTNTPINAPDGIRGLGMIDGAFVGFNANFDFTTATTTVPPVATDDASTVPPGSTAPITIDVLANDSDLKDGAPPAGNTVTLANPTSALSGPLTNNGDGTITYTPPAGLNEGDVDTFQYTITNTQGVISNTATVTITVINNIAPAAANVVQFSTDEDTAKTINITDTGDLGTAVATDADAGQTLAFASVESPTTQGGTVQINPGSDSITYTPAQDFNGTDTFNFFVNDGFENSTAGQMTIDVAAVNDAPVCNDVNFSTPPDTSLSIDVDTKLVAAACSDVDGDSISFGDAILPAGSGGILNNDGLGTLTYSPEAGFEGDDSFTFTVSDGVETSVAATANIKVSEPFGNFTMLDSTGAVFGGTNDIVFLWDGVSLNTDETDVNFDLMEIKSVKPQPFFGFVWTAHHIRVFGPGTYSFDTTCTNSDLEQGKGSQANPCNNPLGDKQTERYLSMTVGTGQIGVHILFDWNTTKNIDVVNVYDVDATWDRHGKTGKENQLWDGAAGSAPDPATVWALVSTDVNGDGYNGSPMVDGPFQGFYANFNSIVNLPPGSDVGNAVTDVKTIDVNIDDTDLGGSVLPSLGALGIWSLVLGMFTLVTIRRYS